MEHRPPRQGANRSLADPAGASWPGSRASGLFGLLLACLAPGCGRACAPDPLLEPPALATAPEAHAVEPAAPPKMSSSEPDPQAAARAAMVRTQLAARDIRDEAVLAAMRSVPRHRFVPERLQAQAHADHPLPIGSGQTISQPYIVALMTQLARPQAATAWKHPSGRPLKALDIGTGSGYQAAVLAALGLEVRSIEILCELADSARERLGAVGYPGITVRCGDGYAGWPEAAPFDVILVAAAPDHVPQPLVDQLAPGGRMVIPVGRGVQELRLIERGEDGAIAQRDVLGVRFVPMTGRALEGDP